MTHPIREAKIHTFSRNDTNSGGVAWLARFFPYSVYPIFFTGETEAEAILKAEDLRTEAIEKYETACINRQEAEKKRAAKRAEKKTAKEPNP